MSSAKNATARMARYDGSTIAKISNSTCRACAGVRVRPEESRTLASTPRRASEIAVETTP